MYTQLYVDINGDVWSDMKQCSKSNIINLKHGYKTHFLRRIIIDKRCYYKSATPYEDFANKRTRHDKRKSLNDINYKQNKKIKNI